MRSNQHQINSPDFFPSLQRCRLLPIIINGDVGLEKARARDANVNQFSAAVALMRIGKSFY
jgi:hypothetical protein